MVSRAFGPAYKIEPNQPRNPYSKNTINIWTFLVIDRDSTILKLLEFNYDKTILKCIYIQPIIAESVINITFYWAITTLIIT